MLPQRVCPFETAKKVPKARNTEAISPQVPPFRGLCAPTPMRVPMARNTEAYLPQAPPFRELCAPYPHEGVLRNTPYDPRRSRRSPLSNPLSLHPLGASLLLSLNLCFKVGSFWYGWGGGFVYLIAVRFGSNFYELINGASLSPFIR